MSPARVMGYTDDPVVQFFVDACDELAAARAKHPDEEGVLTDAEWLAVLTEEVGECARAIQDETDEHLRAELVQVPAMAMRWALSIPQGRKRPPWAERSWNEPLSPDLEDLARALSASHGLTLAEAVNRLMGTRATEEIDRILYGAPVVPCTRDGATCEREPCCRRPRNSTCELHD